MRRTALLLTLQSDNREMEELAFSLGTHLVATVRQSRPYADPELFLGKGKLEEARALARELGVTTVLVNGDLKPSQVFNLVRFFRGEADASSVERVREALAAGSLEAAAREANDAEAASEGRDRSVPPDALRGVTVAPPATRTDTAPPNDDGIDVFDRTRVILEIFKERARSPEARLQVELARLNYEIPLVKETIHLMKRGERPGFLAGGSYEVDQYYDMIKRRTTKIRGELDRIRRERDTRRKHRRRGGFHLVSLAGYTNAGKSSLLEALADTETVVENRYFTTLGTTTRRVVDDRREILLTDTVGFIQDLPPWLVEAFHSTLEEIALADLILLVVDVSDALAEIERKLRSSLRVLWEFQAPQGTGDMRRPPTPILVVFNKSDAVDPRILDDRVGALLREGLIDDNWVAVSAKGRENLEALREAIRRDLPGYARLSARIPSTNEGERVMNRLHEETDVATVERTANGLIVVSLEVRHELLPSIVRDIEAAAGTWLHPDTAPPTPSPLSGSTPERFADPTNGEPENTEP